MRNLLTYEQFIFESASNDLINDVLDKLEPTIENMINQFKVWFVENIKKQPTDFDIEMYRLTIIRDLVRSFEIYTLPTDTIQSLTASGSPKGTITISTTIQRGESVYPFVTDVIFAGGYNIQRLHYRYLTKTSLPKEGKEIVTKEYTDKIKKLSKAEKLNKEIKDIELRIAQNLERANKNKSLTDDEIMNILRDEESYLFVPWEEMVRRGADKNFNYDENEYKRRSEESLKDSINFWKSKNIKWPTEDAEYAKKSLIKLKAKLQTIMQNN